MIVSLPVKELVQALTNSADFHHMSIDEVLAWKANDYHFHALVTDMEARGQLSPICITKAGTKDSCWPSGDGVPRGWELGQGHHRLAAAIYLGFPEVLVDLNDYWDNDETARNYRVAYADPPDGMKEHYFQTVGNRVREWRYEYAESLMTAELS